MASLARAFDWKAVLAAMVYLATFLAITYGLYSVARGGSFIDSLALAFPVAFAACFLFFASASAYEALNASLRKTRDEAKRLTIPSYIHR